MSVVAGRVRLIEGGARGLSAEGYTQVLSEAGCCQGCCTPHVLGRATTNRLHGPECWDLTPFQGPGKATCCAYWRIVETDCDEPPVFSRCYPQEHPWYGAGCVTNEGELSGLPSEFCSEFDYDGCMELQIGCLVIGDPTLIEWPHSCFSFRTPVFRCT